MRSKEILTAFSVILYMNVFVYPSTATTRNDPRRQLHDYPFRNVSLSWQERVADLVGRLTLEEIQEQMGRGGAGNIGGPAPAIPRLGIGPYEWDTECLRGDAETPGYATAFPQPLGLAASFSPNLIYEVAEATSVEVRGKHNDFVKQGNYGFHTGASCFSPVINIMRDPRWGRNQETYGEDPYLNGVMGASYIQGLQGDDPRYVRASGGCKHFDVHGGPENIPVSRFSFNAVVSENDWRTTFLPAFRMCVEAGSYSVMCSYNRINGVPACANQELLTNILRNEWNFTGYVVSDQGAIENIISEHHYYNDSVSTVAGCVNAGVNLELSDNLQNPVFFSLVEAVQQGKLTEQKVREMVAPLFYTRMRLGEFDPPELNPYSNLTSAEVETDDHKGLAVEAALKTFVLLKNNGVLPLPNPDNIAVVGPMANVTSDMFGDYAPNVPDEDIVTVLQGMAEFATNVHFASGCDNPACKNYDRDSVLNVINNTAVIFVVLGTGQTVEAEGRDRPDLELPGQQKALLTDVIQNTPMSTPIILILLNAGPLNISFAESEAKVSAILECFLPAQASGSAIWRSIANLGGQAGPAGRLPFTWPLLASQLPDMVNYSMDGRTYRYFKGDPLYPFGYGLSYTTFAYRALTVPASIKAGDPLLGQVLVSNVGEVDSEEVVQIYIEWLDSSLSTPKLQLVFFNRYILTAGQRDLVVPFKIEAHQMAVWMNEGWVVPNARMAIHAGGQQPYQKKTVPSNVELAYFNIVGSKHLGRF
ncbi:LOW QUALITY PROTEIN: probable beta-D-xylosidase 2 [Pomacea canaliculata]|uniref:LOW QUALITY PROTEIN: probable beta-D-xylosidase 2 n=1 Tax=Pomacea canaliculata TaxID=400727 RepID=UPI000D73D539|nr:LOW QUALITY PROTEIN: probable beta-D-xylosidase 2 [Pomacea canaliculata]